MGYVTLLSLLLLVILIGALPTFLMLAMWLGHVAALFYCGIAVAVAMGFLTALIVLTTRNEAAQPSP